MDLNPTNERTSILAEIEQNKTTYIAFLQQFIRAASPNPPGDTVRAAEVIKTYLSQHNIDFQTISPLPRAPNVVADFQGEAGQGKRVILNGHIDTYPVEKPDAWEKGPYSGYNDGTSIHGRGGVDMKAGTAASIIAFTLLRKRARFLKGSVGLTAVSDEESGGKWGTRYLLEECGEVSPWLGDCVLNGEPGGLESVRFGEKGTLRIRFMVEAKGANGSYTFLGEGAIVIACRLVVKLLELEMLEPDLPDDLRRHMASDRVRRAADAIMGVGAADALLKTSVNIGTIDGGVTVNTIPEHCVFKADIRLPIGLEARTVLDKIDQYLQDFPQVSYEVNMAASNPANFCAFKHPFADCVISAAKDATGVAPVMLTGLGGTDCKFYRYRGIPTYVYGPSPKGMGGSEESVLIDEFIAAVRVHTLAVWDYLVASGI